MFLNYRIVRNVFFLWLGRTGELKKIRWQAWAETIQELPHARLLAAHIRSGALSREAAVMMTEYTQDEVNMAVNDLERLQAECRAQSVFKNAHASGIALMGGKPTAPPWLEVDFAWLKPAQKARDSAATQEQIQDRIP